MLAQNVIPPTVSSANTIFQYYKLSSSTGAFTALSSGEVPTAASARMKSRRSRSTSPRPLKRAASKLGGRTVPFNDAVVLRFNATETGSEAEDEPCT